MLKYLVALFMTCSVLFGCEKQPCADPTIISYEVEVRSLGTCNGVPDAQVNPAGELIESWSDTIFGGSMASGDPKWVAGSPSVLSWAPSDYFAGNYPNPTIDRCIQEDIEVRHRVTNACGPSEWVSDTMNRLLPDLTPELTIVPDTIVGVSTIELHVTVSEILNSETCGPIYVFIPKSTRLSNAVYDPMGSGIVSGFTVNNADWQFTDNPAFPFYLWEYIPSTFTPGGNSHFYLSVDYDPEGTTGNTSITSQIEAGSGGEKNSLNNTSSAILNFSS